MRGHSHLLSSVDAATTLLVTRDEPPLRLVAPMGSETGSSLGSCSIAASNELGRGSTPVVPARERNVFGNRSAKAAHTPERGLTRPLLLGTWAMTLMMFVAES